MKMRITVVLPSLMLSVLVTACAPSLGQQYKRIEVVPPNKGIVNIYRPNSFMGGGVYYDVKANGKVVTTLYRGGYYPYIADPGEIEFSAKTEASDSATVDVKANQVYYLKGTVGIGFVVGRPHLTVVGADVGEAEIAECKLLPTP